MNKEKLESIYVDTINKALTATEAMTDLNAKSLSYANIAQALAMVLAGGPTVNNSTVSTSTKASIETSLEVKNEAALTSSTNKVNTVTNTWVPPVDEYGIPYLPEEFKTDPMKSIAYNVAMKTPEVKAKLEERKKAEAEKVLKESEIKAKEVETAKVETKAEAPKTKSIAKKTVGKEKAKEEKPTVSKEILDKLENYKLQFDFDNEPTKLNGLLYNCTSGTYSSVKDIPSTVIESFVLFLDMEFGKLFEKLDGYREGYGDEYLNNALNIMYDEDGTETYNIEEHVGYNNIIEFLEFVDKSVANSWFEIYQNGDENGDYQLDPEDLRVFATQLFEDGEATIDWINDDNVVAFVDLINQSFEQ